MARNYGVFERFLQAAERTGDIMLRLQFQKDMIRQSLLDAQTKEALVSEITERVLQSLSLTVDAKEIFDAIDGLNEKIESLGK